MEQTAMFPTAHLVVRKDGTTTRFNAGDAIAALIDVLSLNEIPLLPSQRARLGRDAREALEVGYTPEEVVTAMTDAVYCSRIDLVGKFLLERKLMEKRGVIKDPKTVWAKWTPAFSADLARKIGQYREAKNEMFRRSES